MLAVAAIAFAATDTTYSQKYTTKRPASRQEPGPRRRPSIRSNSREQQPARQDPRGRHRVPEGHEDRPEREALLREAGRIREQPCPKKHPDRLWHRRGPPEVPRQRPDPGERDRLQPQEGPIALRGPVGPRPGARRDQADFQGLKLVTVLTPLCVLNDCATNGEAVLTKFHLDTKAYSKTVKKKKGKDGEEDVELITSPAKCPRRLEVHGRFTYDDGTTKTSSRWRLARSSQPPRLTAVAVSGPASAGPFLAVGSARRAR